MKNSLQPRRSLSYFFLLAALAVCVCLQIVIGAVQPQGLLAVLASLFRAPGYVSYPYNASFQVTLLSSPTAFYTGTVPNSFIWRSNDGAITQKVPERLFAVYKDILYLDNLASDLEKRPAQVRAIREDDGKELWSYSSTNLVKARMIDGILFFILSTTSQEQGIVQAHDPISGRLLWQYSCSVQDCYLDFPEVQQGIAYLLVQGSSSSALLALRTSDGRLLWQVSQYMDTQQPLLTSNHLLVWTSTDTLTAYRPIDGRMLWQVHVVPNENPLAPGMTSNGTIDLISSLKTLYAFNATSGALLWQRQDSPLEVQMSDTDVYLSESGGLVALNATSGQQLWQQIYPSWAIKPAINMNPAQANTILGDSNGILYMLLKGSPNSFDLDGVFAFNAADGQLLWQREFTLPTTQELSAPTGGQSSIASSDMEALLAGNTVYFTGYQAVTTIAYFHMTLSVSQTLYSFFNMTTFTLFSEALDGQTGNVKWRNQQVEQFHVA